ncbi:MAG TPA: glycosyltransferase family 2 protein [bacterium]|nr:glycosyltransferase family 2 protein [bacterium]HNT65126.1 glycosyltransferase family 2 protein [bacterium]
MMNKKPSPPIPDFSLSIFFPIYNDWATVASLVAQSIMAAEKLTDDFEVILVDDGSEEKTQKVLTFLESTFSRVRVIHHEKNRGYGGALRTGFRESRKKYIFYTDGDAQYDVTELQNLAAALDETVDIVNGYKIKRNDPIYRVWIGKIYHLVSRFLFNLPIRDVDCDFRLIRRELFDSINLTSTSGTICVEMVYKLARNGASFREVPVRHYFRASGKSQFFNFKRLFRVARDYAVIWYKLVVLKKE